MHRFYKYGEEGMKDTAKHINQATMNNIHEHPDRYSITRRKGINFIPCQRKSVRWHLLRACEPRVPSVTVKKEIIFISFYSLKRVSAQLTCRYIVRWHFGNSRSTAWRPGIAFHPSGARESEGCATGSSSKESKDCRSLMSMNDTSLYANYLYSEWGRIMSDR